MTGHGQVQQQNVRLQLAGEFDRFGAVASLTDHLEVDSASSRPAQSVTKNWVVIGDNDMDRL